MVPKHPVTSGFQWALASPLPPVDDHVLSGAHPVLNRRIFDPPPTKYFAQLIIEISIPELLRLHWRVPFEQWIIVLANLDTVD